jgi:hypothetical protein
MNCPHCGFHFKVAAVNVSDPAAIEEAFELAPCLCESCLEISLIVKGQIRKITDVELLVLKQSEAYAWLMERKAMIRKLKKAQNARNN